MDIGRNRRFPLSHKPDPVVADARALRDRASSSDFLFEAALSCLASDPLDASGGSLDDLTSACAADLRVSWRR